MLQLGALFRSSAVNRFGLLISRRLLTTGTDFTVATSETTVSLQYLSEEVKCNKQRLAARLTNVIQEFQRFPGDVGSSEVQVAVLTEKIRSLESHFRDHKHDYQGMRGLRAWLNQRNSLMRYLRQKDFEKYCVVLQKLGLRDQFAKQARLDNYKVGTSLGDDGMAIDRYARGEHYPRQRRQQQMEIQATRRKRMLQLSQRRKEKVRQRQVARELRQSVQRGL